MTGADSTDFVPATDRRLMRRLTVWTFAAIAVVVAFHRLHLFYAQKLYDTSGRAQWIWQRSELSRENPVAFFATRDFNLPPNRAFTHVKVAADPEYTVYFNGAEVGGRVTGGDRRLDVYDVGPLARDGRNRLVIAVRSAKGVGGLLAAIDLSAEVANFIVTDASWGIVRVWSPALLREDPLPVEQPLLLGEPPAGRWNFLSPTRSIPAAVPAKTIRPKETLAYKAQFPVVKVVQGVTIASSRTVRATAFDFGGFLDARVRLAIDYDSPMSHVVYIRFANVREELMRLEGNLLPVVFAAHEREVTVRDPRHFRYIGVYGGNARADAVQ